MKYFIEQYGYKKEFPSYKALQSALNGLREAALMNRTKIKVKVIIEPPKKERI